jgi:glycosyltransferase involved in cell wall biosynthesis
MRVFVIGTRGFPDIQGGIEKHCEKIYPRLVKLGCHITVLTRTPYIPRNRRIVESQGVRFIHVWTPRSKYVEAIIHTFLGVIIARIKSPNIVHFHAVGPSLFIPLAKLLGLRVVMTHHGPDYLRKKWGGLAKLILRLGEFLGVVFADYVLAVSKTVKTMLTRRYRTGRVEYIPNGVDMPERSTNTKMLAKFDLEPQKFIFTACRFVPEKGLHDLITAYSKLTNPGFKLVIAGDADHETAYSRKIKKFAAQNKDVVMTGFLNRTQLSEFYINAKLFILPSYYEGLPITLLEAMSYDLPVLVSDIPATREIPLPEYRYFSASDTVLLAKKISELFNHPLSKKEVAANRKTISKNYNWLIIAQKTCAVYRQVLGL